MSESFPLPTEPEGVIPSLLKRFTLRKIEAMMALTPRRRYSSRKRGDHH